MRYTKIEREARGGGICAGQSSHFNDGNCEFMGKLDS